MSFKILPTPPFEKELKKLANKYPSIKTEFRDLLVDLSLSPQLGTSLGSNCYKIRLAISSKNKGKSGGARVITFVQVVHEVIYLLSIYDKADLSNITDHELSERIKNL